MLHRYSLTPLQSEVPVTLSSAPSACASQHCKAIPNIGHRRSEDSGLRPAACRVAVVLPQTARRRHLQLIKVLFTDNCIRNATHARRQHSRTCSLLRQTGEHRPGRLGGITTRPTSGRLVVYQGRDPCKCESGRLDGLATAASASQRQDSANAYSRTPDAWTPQWVATD
jgi:hypothetical protein